MKYFIADKELKTCFRTTKVGFLALKSLLDKSCIEYTERYDDIYKQIEVSIEVYLILKYLYVSSKEEERKLKITLKIKRL